MSTVQRARRTTVEQVLEANPDAAVVRRATGDFMGQVGRVFFSCFVTANRPGGPRSLRINGSEGPAGERTVVLIPVDAGAEPMNVVHRGPIEPYEALVAVTAGAELFDDMMQLPLSERRRFPNDRGYDHMLSDREMAENLVHAEVLTQDQPMLPDVPMTFDAFAAAKVALGF